MSLSEDSPALTSLAVLPLISSIESDQLTIPEIKALARAGLMLLLKPEENMDCTTTLEREGQPPIQWGPEDTIHTLLDYAYAEEEKNPMRKLRFTPQDIAEMRRSIQKQNYESPAEAAAFHTLRILANKIQLLAMHPESNFYYLGLEIASHLITPLVFVEKDNSLVITTAVGRYDEQKLHNIQYFMVPYGKIQRIETKLTSIWTKSSYQKRPARDILEDVHSILEANPTF